MKLYEENDLLSQMLDQARQDLGENATGLPGAPRKQGSLKISRAGIGDPQPNGISFQHGQDGFSHHSFGDCGNGGDDDRQRRA